MKGSVLGVVGAILALAFAFVLAACGAQGSQPAAPTSSSGTADQESAKQATSGVYLPVKIVISGNDGWTRTLPEFALSSSRITGWPMLDVAMPLLSFLAVGVPVL